MSELPPDQPSIAATGADADRRKAAAHEAHGANTNHAAPGERYPLSGGSRIRGGHDVDIYAFGTDEGPLVAEGKSRHLDVELAFCDGIARSLLHRATIPVT
jgi:hypothetical protein